jgi:malate dehydrogenase
MTVITAETVERASGELIVAKGDVITPLARDKAAELGITIRQATSNGMVTTPPRHNNIAQGNKNPTPPRSIPPVAPLQKGNVPATTQLGAFSGALYRRGAPLPSVMAPIAANSRAAASTNRTGRPRAAVIGAGHVGSTTTLRLVETSLFEDVTMIDIVEGLAEGLALDMWHSAGLRGFTTRVKGASDLSALADVDYIVMTAGRPRKPGMSRTDLTAVNAQIIEGVAAKIRQYAPNAVVVVVTNPLEEMTELMCRRTGFPPERVIGMAGVLDSVRFCSLVALTGIAGPGEVEALALGSHGPEMVIPLSLATAKGRPLKGQIPDAELDAIVERARNSGGEVVGLLKTGSAYYAPADSAAMMVRHMVTGDHKLIAACVQSRGAYGLSDTRVGLPVRLGPGGVAEIVELSMTADERAALRKAADSIAARIAELG